MDGTDADFKLALRQCNERLIAAILKKAETVCPGSIAMIGVYGSFQNGDIHSRSDLDLCIVINDDRGWKISDCFILDGIGYDIYCTPWSRLEALSTFPHAYVGNLLNLDIVYHADESSLNRYLDLRERLQQVMAEPFNDADVEKVTRYLNEAKTHFADMLLSTDCGECKFGSAQLLLALENLCFAANKAFIQKGIRQVPAEIRALHFKPSGFDELAQQMITCGSIAELQQAAGALLKNSRTFAESVIRKHQTRRLATADQLRGHYEEVFSNWRNKMVLAADTCDRYLALMTMASCQRFYSELAAEVDVPDISLFTNCTFEDLNKAVTLFDDGLAKLEKLYHLAGLTVKRFDSLTAFERAYLSQEG